MLHEKELNLTVYLAMIFFHTNSLLLLVKNILCGQEDCQKGSNLILFSCQISGRAARSERACDSAPFQSLGVGFWVSGFVV